MRKSAESAVVLLLAAMAAASMWFYVIGILRAHQIADSQARQIPRGNLSDLYPRWLGARELLLHHRNPYSREIALEIQEGYYGRRLDPLRPNDPKDQQSFAYPVYVVFLLAPLIGLPFPAVMTFFYWSLVLLTGASVLLWLRVLRCRLPASAAAVCILLTLGSFPAVQGIKLEQLSLLVAALIAGTAACVASGFLFVGGALLALATIKPQLTWPLVAWLLLWAMSDWRARRMFIVGFGTVMTLLLAGAEIILPGWWRMFAEALGQYHQYTQNQSVMEVILNEALGSAGGPAARVGAEILEAIALIACVPVLWKLRREPADATGFGEATALVLALTVLVVPMYAPYNQVLLLPAVVLLARERALLPDRSRALFFGYLVGVFALTWQWIASFGLTATYTLVSRVRALQGWSWPFFGTFAVPAIVFLLTLFCVQDKKRAPGRAKTFP